MPARAAARRPYHHGDLRRTLLEAALAEIAAKGPTGWSLRDIARRAGVSHAAPAHHFQNKRGLLIAIAVEGFSMLEQAQRDAVAPPGAGLVESGIATIRFALEHRAHFELMFGPELYRTNDPTLLAARQSASDALSETVRAALGDATDEEVWGGVIASWSFTYGFASLMLNMNLAGSSAGDIEAGVRLASASLIRLVESGALGPTQRTAG